MARMRLGDTGHDPEPLSATELSPRRGAVRRALDEIVGVLGADAASVTDTRHRFSRVITTAGAPPANGGSSCATLALTTPDGRRLGSLEVVYAGTGRGPDERDEQLLTTVAGLIAAQLESDEAYVAVRRTAEVESLLLALRVRDGYTDEHTDAVVRLALELGARLGLDDAPMADLEQLAGLHDIGKLGIPDSVLHKPGPLEGEEWAIMRRHPAIAEAMVSERPTLAHLAPALRAAHEHWDGGGYPDGLAGEAIPFESRIVLVCDAWHAMISDRPYRAALPEDHAVAELRDNAGTQFDPTVVAALLGP